MPLADDFQEILDSLPSDWTDLELDLRVAGGPLHRRRDAARHLQRAAVLARTTGTSGSSSRTSSATPPRRRVVARHAEAARRRRDRAASSCCARCATGRVETVQMWGRPRVGAPGVPPHPRAVDGRVLAVFDDLLLGSNVLGMLRAAGHEAQLTGGAGDVHPDGADVLIVDLGGGRLRRRRARRALRAAGELAATRTLGVYSHVDVDTRRRAEARASTSWCRARGWRARAPRSSSGCGELTS